MDPKTLPDNPYILLTPGPLSTSKGVRAAMFRDWCTWDGDYNAIVQSIRARLTALATGESGYTAVLMQGSGTFCVEATIGTALPPDGKLLVLANGHYGDRIAQIAGRLRIDHAVVDSGEISPSDVGALERSLEGDPRITHVAVVHCETTTGMLNPVEEVGRIVHRHGRSLIVDAMSSFGGMPIDLAALKADYLVSSANKCIQGVPGFGFVVARREALASCAGNARSLSLDLHAQWREMEEKGGKWRYTSPTHVVRAFSQALRELEEEGGVAARFARYSENHRTLVSGMRRLGFETLLPDKLQSPIITSFIEPGHPGYKFERFYAALKNRGFVIYPGKVTAADTFRIGTIGQVFPADMARLIDAVERCLDWL
jgi:2-aminoethylphosphonate-pyruvate transaminase